MGSLEAELKRIEVLKDDLSATLPLTPEQEEQLREHNKGWTKADPDPESVETARAYREIGYGGWGNSGGSFLKTPPPAPDLDPDTETREKAIAELRTIFDTSDWYTARYQAGTHLISRGELEKTLNMWLTEAKAAQPDEDRHQDLKELLYMLVYQGGLEDDQSRIAAILDVPYTWLLHEGMVAGKIKVLNTIRIVYDKSPERAFRRDAGYALGYNDTQILSDELLIHKTDLNPNELDIVYRGATERAARQLVGKKLGFSDTQILSDELTLHSEDFDESELKSLYTNAADKSTRVLAGRALGHSSIRLWVHEHPVAATGIGVATAAATAYGLAHMLAENLSK